MRKFKLERAKSAGRKELESGQRPLMNPGERLYKKGKNKIFVVGSPALDNLVNLKYDNSIEPYFLILHHPNTTDPENITPLLEALEIFNTKKIWVNPCVDAGSKSMLKQIHKHDIEFRKGLNPDEYYKLLVNCQVLIGNTSSGIKEGAFLGVPYVCVGTRQNNREHANNTVFCDMNKQQIVNCIFERLIGDVLERDKTFGNGQSGIKISRILKEID